jgi:hypothetical protein
MYSVCWPAEMVDWTLLGVEKFMILSRWESSNAPEIG